MEIGDEKIDPKTQEYIEEIKSIIENARNSIQEEFSRSENSRIACTKNIIDVIDCYRGFKPIKEYIEQEKYKEINKQIEASKIEAKNLEGQYSEKYPEPAENIKNKMLQHLLEIKNEVDQIILQKNKL